MHSYHFFGKIYPERYNINISNQRSDFKHGQGLEGTLSTWIQGSQFVIDVFLKAKHKDIYTLRNIVEYELKRQINIMGFVKGYKLTHDIISCTDSEHNKWIFGPFVPLLTRILDQKKYDVDIIYKLTFGINGQYLCRALNDLCESILVSNDVGFFAYRAIETLKLYFLEQYEEANTDKEAWSLMRKKLKIDKKDIVFIKSYADRPRHGGIASYDGDEGNTIYTTSWSIMDKFIHYATKSWG